MAQLLGMDTMLVYQVYLNAMFADGSAEMPLVSVQQFLSFVVDGMVPDPQFAGMFDETALAGLMQARAIVDASILGTEYDALTIASLLGIDYTQVYQIMAYRAYLLDTETMRTLDLATLVPHLLELATPAEEGQTERSAARSALEIDENQLAKLELVATVMEDAQSGKVYTASQMAELLGTAAPDLSASDVELLYLLQAAVNDTATAKATMTLEEFVGYAADEFAADPLFADVVDADQTQELADSKDALTEAKDQLVGPQFARAVIEANFPRESQEMQDLVNGIADAMETAGAEYYLVGDAAMATEMRASFSDEFNFITVLTAGVIFLIVMVAFRSFFVPLLLVALIQTAINLAMGITVLQGISTYYVAIMVVQALLMGATIDYAILFTESYREMRLTRNPRDSISGAFKTSIGTIMTSSSILVLVTFAVGMTSADVTIAEVCLTISKGSLVAVTLVVFILPGTLAALDPLVAGPRRLRKSNVQNEPPTPPAALLEPEAQAAAARPVPPVLPLPQMKVATGPDGVDRAQMAASTQAGLEVLANAGVAIPQRHAADTALEDPDFDEPSAHGEDGDWYYAAHFAAQPAQVDALEADVDAPTSGERESTTAVPAKAASDAAPSLPPDDSPEYSDEVWAELLRLAVPNPRDDGHGADQAR